MAGGQQGLAGWPQWQVSRWLPLARRTWRTDVVAGLTLWGLAVPQGIAYADLAGLSPAAGVWPVVIMLVVYALWGVSRQLVCTPLSSTAVMMAGLIATFPVAARGPSAACAILLTVAACFLLAYLFRLGFVVNFISDPINAGFMFGLSIVIAVGQANKLLGVPAGEGNALAQAWSLIQHLPQTQPVTLAIAVLGFALMLGLPRVWPAAPAGLVMILVTTLLVAGFHLDERYGVVTPGAIPTGLPELITPDFTAVDPALLISGAVGMMLLALSEAASNGRELADRNGEQYRLGVDLFPFALGNALSSTVGGILAVGSTSTTSANTKAGAQTPVSTLTTALAALLTVLFLGGAVASLPMASLAVLIIVSVWGRINTRFLTTIRQWSVAEASVAAASGASVLLFGVLDGLLIAMAISLVWFVQRATSVRFWRVGPSTVWSGALVRMGTPSYQPLPEGVEAVRFEGQIFYGNVVDVLGALDDLAARGPHDPPLRALILDLEGQGYLDYTSARTLTTLIARLGEHGALVIGLGVRDALVDSLQAQGTLPPNLVLRRTTDLSTILADVAAGRTPASDNDLPA